ncbi:hypothetical protein AAVH_26835 [Aphelenchoides avenae]|nr:hypothetical protein AAVH_26835 [Aphelenchus avenae]
MFSVEGKIQETFCEVVYYTRSDNDERTAVAKKIDCGDIVVATNLAGRGTDFKTSDAVDLNGGLSVLLTFLPANPRVYEQAFGRTARQGKPGTAQLICLKPEVANDYADIDGILTSREASQLVFNRLQQANLDFQDDAFAEYAKMLKEFRRKKQNGNWGRCRLDNAKLSQLDDMWGLKLEELNAWLRTPSKRSTITAKKSRYTIARGQLSTFLRRCSERLYADEELALFEKGLGTPAYLVEAAYFEGRYNNNLSAARRWLTHALTMDDHYNYFAYFHRAVFALYGLTKVKGAKPWMDKALADFECAKKGIDPVISAWTAMHEMPVRTVDPASELSKQLFIKIAFLKKHMHHIDVGMEMIRKCPSDQITRVKRWVRLSEGMKNQQELDAQVIKVELDELAQYAMDVYVELEHFKPPPPWWAVVFLAVIGVAQIALGAVVSVVHPAAGGALISSGVSDIIDAIEVARGKKEFSWDDYFAKKGLQVVDTVVTSWFSALAKDIPLLKKFVPASTSTIQPAKSIGKTVAREIVKQAAIVGVKYAVEGLMDHLPRLKEQIKAQAMVRIRKLLNQRDVYPGLTMALRLLDGFQQRVTQCIEKVLSYIDVAAVARRVMKHLKNRASTITGVIVLTVIEQIIESSGVLDLLNTFCNKFKEMLKPIKGTKMEP